MTEKCSLKPQQLLTIHVFQDPTEGLTISTVLKLVSQRSQFSNVREIGMLDFVEPPG